MRRGCAAAGIAVDVGLLESAARELNIGFVSRVTRGRPWVRMKVAASLDGRTALVSGESKWITGEAARADGHRWRARACAILTGIGTVLQDDPQLTVRAVATPRQPQRIVIDRHGADAAVGAGACGRQRADRDGGRAQSAMARRASRCWRCRMPIDASIFVALMQALGARGINELHVEAGGKLNGALLAAGSGRRDPALSRPVPARAIRRAALPNGATALPVSADRVALDAPRRRARRR